MKGIPYKQIVGHISDNMHRYWLSMKGFDFDPDYSFKSSQVAQCTSVSFTQTLDAISRIKNLDKYIFYDIGAGKGYVAFHAVMKEFNRVICIEMIPELARKATLNLDKIRHKKCGSVEIAVCDAREFSYSDQDSVFYFFNPFPGEIFYQCITRILYKVKLSDLFIIIVHPVSDAYPSILEKLGFNRIESINYGFTKTLIYKKLSQNMEHRGGPGN